MYETWLLILTRGLYIVCLYTLYMVPLKNTRQNLLVFFPQKLGKYLLKRTRIWNTNMIHMFLIENTYKILNVLQKNGDV